MTNQGFNDGASQELFIGGRSLAEVIAQDTRELAEIGGSFGEIADRMDHIIDLANTERDAFLDVKRREIFRKYGHDTDELLDLPGSTSNPESEAGKVYAELTKLYYETPWIFPGEDQVGIVGVVRTRGMQECPFGGCSQSNAGSNAEYRIKNVKTGRGLTINELTSHLARAHHILEKDNQYGISAGEFYEHFMLGNRGMSQNVEVGEGEVPVLSARTGRVIAVEGRK